MARFAHQTLETYTISTDPQCLDLDVIHGFLSTSYWASERSRQQIELAIERSLSFGLFDGLQQVGFGRVVSDGIAIAYIADVFVLPAHRGRGLGRWLVDTMLCLPELRDVRRWLLGTRDAHQLYRKLGFSEPKPGVLMERLHSAARLP